jgi:hypothetical protein
MSVIWLYGDNSTQKIDLEAAPVIIVVLHIF